MIEQRPGNNVFVIWSGQVLVRSAASPQPIDVSGRVGDTAGMIPVFTQGGNTIAAYLLDAGDEPGAHAALRDVAPGGVFAEVMIDLGRYDAAVRNAVVRGIAIERWSNRYRFCPACGTPLIWTTDSIAKICTNPQRVHRHFPRLDPAIIVLVTDGDRVLLGRSRRFPPGFYSTLAGFVEPGETVEAALRREVYEEAGIRVGSTQYFGSESWPFPRSLMLGFFAQAQSSAIALHDAELEDARWFDRGQLRELQDEMKVARPFFDTIARRLIDAWLEQPVTESPRAP